jgi:uncharacterized protein YjbI with pentapeptide repeats
MTALKSVAPPLPPHLAAYEPFDADEYDEPAFDRLHMIAVIDWPEADGSSWRFDTCKLEQCAIMSQTLTLRVWDSILVRCDLSASKFFGAGLLRSEFLGCRATGIQLGESTIKDVSFQNCKLNMVSFRKCKLERVIFENCILDDADFNNAHLIDVTFVNCEMRGTDFSGASCSRVDLTKTSVGDLKGVRSLKGARVLPEQAITLTPLLCAELGIVIVQ